MDFKKLMKDSGWLFFKTCGCGGTTTHKFRKEQREIHIKPQRSKFSLFLNGRIQLTDNLVNLSNHV